MKVDKPWPGPSERTDENLVHMTRTMRTCISRWPNRAPFYAAQFDQFAAECERRGLGYEGDE